MGAKKSQKRRPSLGHLSELSQVHMGSVSIKSAVDAIMENGQQKESSGKRGGQGGSPRRSSVLEQSPRRSSIMDPTGGLSLPLSPSLIQQ